ncbi:MAG: hypothetical protein D6772_13090 [Bacteroidetes bacterium]|nr:MAG: hypothetical protein D6772_13090 [Bacteroidota bacterium]
MKTNNYLILLLILTLASCASLEQRCLERFPTTTTEVVRTETRTDTIILPWHTVEFVDTTICPPSQDTLVLIQTKTKQLPPRIITHEVQCVDTVLVQQDAARVAYLTQQLNQLLTQKTETQRKQSRNTWLIVGLGAFVLLLLFLLIRGYLLIRRG